MKNGSQPINPAIFRRVGDGDDDFVPADAVKRTGYEVSLGGLTKREYFAAMAMSSLISASNACDESRDKYTVNGGWIHSQTVAMCAIQMADELLKQLEN